MELSKKNSNSYRYINELNSISQRIASYDLSRQDMLFSLGLSQQQSQRGLKNTIFGQQMKTKELGASLNQNLFNKQLSMIPSFQESFFAAFLPGATQAIGNVYTGYKQKQNQNQQRQYMQDYLGMLNNANARLSGNWGNYILGEDY